MSVPQNNLDDLKRRLPAGPAQPTASQSGGHTSKCFKFKSSAGPSHSPAALLPSAKPSGSQSNYFDLYPHTSKAKPPSINANLHTLPAKPPTTSTSSFINNQSRPTTPLSGLPPSSNTLNSSSPSSGSLKRSTSFVDVQMSGGSNKRLKKAKSQDMIQDETTTRLERETADEILILREQEMNSRQKLVHTSSVAATNVSAQSTGVDSDLLAHYEMHTTNDLQMMLTNNMSTRLDIVDKLLKALSGQEPGLDHAMLQETSKLLERRIIAIKIVVQCRQSGGSHPNLSRANALGQEIGAYPTKLMINTLQITNKPDLYAGSNCHADENRFLPAASSSESTSTEDVSDMGTSLLTNSFSREVDMLTVTSSVNIQEDEEALWAQLDVPPDNLEMLTSSTSKTPFQPKTNIYEGGDSPAKRQTFKAAESLSKNTSRQTNTLYHKEIMCKLQEVFHLDSFRPNQLEAINATLSGKDVFVLMPTGGGKSLCYQVPAVCEGGSTRGVTVVVSPLIALMIDQVNHLQKRGVDVVLFNSDQGQENSRQARARLLSRGRKPKLLYVTPEKIHKSGDMRSILAKLYRDGELARFVIDEAHCVSTWGRDFRDAYQDLERLRQEYPKTPIMALTATANEQVMNDVIDRLKIRDCTLLTQSFNRPNLHYEVRPKRRTIISDMATFIQTYHRGHTGIIYCLSRNKCEEVAKELREKYSLKARHYHAAMSVADKQRAQTAWQSGECEIIVATIAFGMGIDKPDVRYVIHHSLPMSLDGYYQETGRAGRDGKKATCLLYYSYGDTKILYKLIQDGDKTAEELKRQEDGVRAVVQYCQNDIDCRRVQVLGYFGQVFNPKDCHKHCNNCIDGTGFVEEDMSAIGCQAIRLVKDLLDRDRNITKLHCLDVFRGANIKAIRDRGHDKVPLFGAGSHLSREQGERLFDHLLGLEAFRQVTVTNKSGWNSMYMQLGPNVDEFLTGKQQLKMMTKLGKTDSTQLAKTTASKTTKTVVRRKSGTVPSVNRTQADDIFEDDVESRSFSRDLIDIDDIYDFGSCPPSPAQSPKRSPKTDPPSSRKEPMDINETDDASQQCYRELLRLRGEIAKSHEINDLDEVADEGLLQIISAILPTDHASFKEVLKENLSQTEADEFWNIYGTRILQVCTNYKMSSSISKKPKFDAIKMHAQYGFQASITNGNNHKGSRVATKAKGPVQGRSGGVRAMPL